MEYSRTHDYAGYSKFDALNSPCLEKCFGGSFIGRLLVTQLVNRSYVNMRPMLGVRKSRNPKGIANFIKSYCNLSGLTREDRYADEAVSLAKWLLENASGKGKYSGLCWGYNFPWQSPGFFAPRHLPNCIVTCFCAEALICVYRLTGDRKYLVAAESAADFILNDLPVLEKDGMHKCIAYVPVPVRWKVI
ncbi:MAG: hypothetical protein JXJ19_02275, partial [Elusimicrobia bacterium]|nr:hypothetical protein [Elusimicrobiota bacterium]